jgi:SAM-dependent MidA family methyltransferase
VRLDDRLKDLIRERGPLTVAAFMDRALYDPDFGYYARSAQRSGRAGDFFTSVDVGALFGELLAIQVAEMSTYLLSAGARHVSLVEAGAGNGRLSADILSSLRREQPALYERIQLHLCEASEPARAAQREMLGAAVDRLSSSSASLPDSFEGVLIANELLDAMPVHQVVMRDAGLREVYVDCDQGRCVTREGPLSTPRLAQYFDALHVRLEPGWRAEVSLRAIDWIGDTVARMKRGFAVLIDYGHRAHELYSIAHSAGTLTSHLRHASAGADVLDPAAGWLANPGVQDLTAHVDFTSVQKAAEAAGCRTLGFLDQMYFLMALGARRFASLDVKQRLALKTLIMPGGLGTTMKVLLLGKDVGAPTLAGCSGVMRVT